MKKFRIYYGDGSIFEGLPEDAPTENVQAIIWDDPDESIGDCGRIVLENWDFYLYSDSIGWHGTNKYADLLMHVKLGCGIGGVRAILQGRWIPYEDYKVIIQRAKNDFGFAKKSGGKPKIENGAE